MLKLDSGVPGSESPVDGRSSEVSLRFQGGDLLFEGVFFGDATSYASNS